MFPAEMNALLLKGDGYARAPSGSVLESMEPYAEYRRIGVPQPGQHQVLVKVAAASVNPSDVMFIKGQYGQPRVQGRPAGFEGVGIVVASGGGHADALMGKRVAFATGTSNWGCWAEYALADARACIEVTEPIADEDAAALIVNPLTAIAMFGLVKAEGAKSFVLSAGASQLCKLIMGLARDEGYRAIALVRRDAQIPLLEQAGAAVVLNSDAADFKVRLREVLAAEAPRIFLDAVTGPLAAQVFHAMGRKSRWVIYGRLDDSETVIREPGQLIFQGKKVEGFWLTEWMRAVPPETRAAASLEAQKRFADGRWKTDVTAVIPLSEAMARLPEELAKPNGKVFLRP